MMNTLNEECNIIKLKHDSILFAKIFVESCLVINDINLIFTNGSFSQFYLEREISSEFFDTLSYNSKFINFDRQDIQNLNHLTGIICIFDCFFIPVVTKGSVPNKPDFYYNRYFYSNLLLVESYMRNYLQRDEIHHEYEGYLYCSFLVLAKENPQLEWNAKIGTILWVSRIYR